MDARCRIELLGELRVIQGNTLHTRFRTRKAASLLAFLAFNRHQAHSRDSLIERFWPDLDFDAGRDNLSTALTQLRSQLEPKGVPSGAVLEANRQAMRLNSQAVTTDVEEFEGLLGTNSRDLRTLNLEALEKAITLYRGPFLCGSEEEWITQARTRLHGAFVAAHLALRQHLEASGNLEAALQCAVRGLEAGPGNEDFLMAQMRYLTLLCRPEEALEIFRKQEKLSRKLLGASLSPAVQQLASRIKTYPETVTLPESEPLERTESSDSGEVSEAPVRSLPDAPTLPLLLSRFVGRDREKAQLNTLLCSPETRLITLLGPGGAGKTRLSIEVAREAAPHFQRRVWFVPLADLPDASLIPTALVNALKLPVSGQSDPVQRVAEYLGQEPCLLVLDNFEHLLHSLQAGKYDQPGAQSASRLVRLLLERIPGLVCLVSSRHALQLNGEQEYLLPPLRLPNPAEPYTPESLLLCDSVTLYVDRARKVKPDFALTKANAEAVAALCRKLEGVPLAIEMAAAWANTVSPARMLEKLERQLDLLGRKNRDMPPRHQSLRATIEWSHDLLEPQLRGLFSRLSLFRGGWTLETAEAICGEDALFDMATLLEQSLIYVQQENSVEPRYRMYESLREFASERLQEEADFEAIFDKYARYFLELIQQQRVEFHGARETQAFEILTQEHDNIRSALQHSLERDDLRELGQSCCADMWWFWMFRGYYDEGRKWLHAALSECDTSNWGIYSSLLNGAGQLAKEQGDVEEALEYGMKSLEFAEKAGDERQVITSRNNLAIAAYDSGRIALSRELWEQNLVSARKTNWDLAIGSTLANLGELAYDEGDLEEGLRLLEEATIYRTKAGDMFHLAREKGVLGKIAHRRGNLQGAIECFRTALKVMHEGGYRAGALEVLDSVGCLGITLDLQEPALTCLYAADYLRQKETVPRPPNEIRELEGYRQPYIERLDSATLERYQKSAQGLSLEQAVAYVSATILADEEIV